MTKKKKDKEPLDLTTEEAIKELFPKEVIDHLKGAIRENDEKKSVSSKSSQKHDTK